MSKLTSQVLDAAEIVSGVWECDWSEVDHAQGVLQDAAPVLARTVERFERLVDQLEEHVKAAPPDALSIQVAALIANTIRQTLQAEDGVKAS